MSAGKQFASLAVTLTRLIRDGAYPDWIEAEFTDANDKRWVFTEKVPVLGVGAIQHLPAPFGMSCLILEEKLSQTGEALRLITLHEEPFVGSEANRHALTCWVRASDLSDAWEEAQK